MHEGRFPYAVALVLIHNVIGAGLASLIYLVKPSLFPSLNDRPETTPEKAPVDKKLILYGIAPIALIFCFQLVLTNTAYLHSSIAFLQMMKEGNLVLVYLLSLAAALEVFSWRHVQVLLIVVFATTLTIKGELHFSLLAFAMQGTGQLFESVRIVLQMLVLTSAGQKLDALTYMLLVTPICVAVLTVFIFGLIYFGPLPHCRLPEVSTIVEWTPVLLLNGLVAFSLNIAIALFIKNSSAVSFILAGIVKDAAIVALGFFLFAEDVSSLQMVGFSVQLLAIVTWSMMKSFPEQFQDGIFRGVWTVLQDHQAYRDRAIASSLACNVPEIESVKQKMLPPPRQPGDEHSYGALEKNKPGPNSP